nr:hypothetical protein CFP56_48898 [Quercus suber]
MTLQGQVVPPPLPLLVNDKEYVVDIAHFIVRDANLDGCSKHETDPLGDFGLHDMMSADDLAKENALLKSEVATLHEHMGKVKEEAIE